jgi:hypothetical protein
VHLPLNEGVGNEIANVCGTAFKVTATGQVSWTPGGKLGPAPVIKPGSTFEVSDAGDFELNQKFSYGAWVKAGRNGVFGAIMARMDEKNGYRGWDLWQNDRGLSVHIIDKWTENAMKVSTRDAALKPGEWQHVFVTYNGSGKAAGIKIYVNGRRAEASHREHEHHQAEGQHPHQGAAQDRPAQRGPILHRRLHPGRPRV